MDRRRIFHIALAVLLIGLGWLYWRQQHASKETPEEKTGREAEAKVVDALRELPGMLAEASQIGLTGHENICYSRAYALLDFQRGVPVGSTEKDLPKLAKRMLQSSNTGPMDRARACLIERKFDEAEAAALHARDEALKKNPQNTAEAVVALELAGLAAEKAWHGGQRMYPKALEHFQAAAALTSKEGDFVEWARVQNDLGRLLDLLGREQESEDLLAAALKTAETRQPPLAEHPMLLRTRCLLAGAQDSLKKHVEAEKNCRLVLAVNERVLGPEHPVTLANRLAVGMAVARFEDRKEEADRIRHEVYEAKKRVLGPDHADTLLSRMTEAWILRRLGRDDEAAAEYRAVAEARDRIVGPTEPESRFAWSTLSLYYYDQGKYAECETIERAQMALQEKAFTFGYRDTLNSCYNLILALQKQDKLDEARVLSQRAAESAKQWLKEGDSLRRRILEIREEMEDRRT